MAHYCRTHRDGRRGVRHLNRSAAPLVATRTEVPVGYGNLNAMSDRTTLVFGTDGSCLKNPDGPTGWAYINQDGRYSYGGRPVGTNQIGELMAILTVLRHHPEQALEIQSDSAYAIGCSSTWKVGWQRAGYVRKTGPIANLDIIREIHQLLDQRPTPVTFVKVKAHLRDETVHPLNVRADDLAGRGARAAAESRGAVEETGQWPGSEARVTPITAAVAAVAAPRVQARPAVVQAPVRAEPESDTGFLF